MYIRQNHGRRNGEPPSGNGRRRKTESRQLSFVLDYESPKAQLGSSRFEQRVFN